MKPRFALRTLAAVGLALGLAHGAAASTLYGSTFSASSLFSVDQSTGALTSIGAMGAVIGDMTSNTSAGIVWGIGLSGEFANQLYTVNTATGAAGSPLAITGVQGQITSIAYDGVTGTMFGNTTAGFGGADALYSIDLSTGVATQIGAIGISNVYALGFAGGALYGVSDVSKNLVSISTATGVGSNIGATGLGFVFDIAARPEDGVMFASDSGNNAMYTVDLATGATTLVGAFGSSQNIAGLAFVGEVPEPSTYVLMIAGLLGLGWIARRRTTG